MSKKYTVTKILNFCAAHRLMEYDGKCANLHGHNYKLEVSVSFSGGKIDSTTDMVVDFSVLKRVQSWLDKTWDHKVLLNSKDPLTLSQCIRVEEMYVFVEANATAESMLGVAYEAIWGMLPTKADITRLKLWETDTCFAEVNCD